MSADEILDGLVATDRGPGVTRTGRLELAAPAALARRDRYRPTDPAALAAEVRRLHRTGLTARDISTALRLQLDQVVNIIGEVSRD